MVEDKAGKQEVGEEQGDQEEQGVEKEDQEEATGKQWYQQSDKDWSLRRTQLVLSTYWLYSCNSTDVVVKLKEYRFSSTNVVIQLE